MYLFRNNYKQIYNKFLSNRNITSNNIINEHIKSRMRLHVLLNNYKDNELTLWIPIKKYDVDISNMQSKRILHEISFIHATCCSPKMLNDIRKHLIRERLLSLYSYANCTEKEIIIKLLNYYKLL